MPVQQRRWGCVLSHWEHSFHGAAMFSRCHTHTHAPAAQFQQHVRFVLFFFLLSAWCSVAVVFASSCFILVVEELNACVCFFLFSLQMCCAPQREEKKKSCFLGLQWLTLPHVLFPPFLRWLFSSSYVDYYPLLLLLLLLLWWSRPLSHFFAQHSFTP